MRIDGAPGQAYWIGRGQEPSPTTDAATDTTTTETDANGPTGGAPAAPARKGSDTPFTHALHQGSGNKHGIRRRFADEIAAQQAAAGLDDSGEASGTTDVADAGEAAGVGEVVAGEADGAEPDAGTTPTGEGTVATDGGTVVIDGSGLLAAATPEPVAVGDGLLALLDTAEEGDDAGPTRLAGHGVAADPEGRADA